MSGAGDDRWRGGRGYDHGRPQGQRHHSGGYRDRQSGSHGHRNQMNNMTATATWTGPPSGPSREAHIPVRSFNSVELKDALRKDYKKGGQGGMSKPRSPQPIYRNFPPYS
ncbi:hypothetical protein H112_02510 [Trichophyton rubrum D6]|uniref:Uncharacterized protein n=3 Tax=Trichophyton TaxID=5550 RepID=A0A080WVZ8_TRIRC|nr:uncharacterized protein TERG_06270 [Trichophyton rubrum CBS 118892]XP_047606829.1 uncharacterized protein TERG_06270 [Trichophyton rubrum CBS 118892]EZF25166.1 hypothetical protein H100_02511 [Trichophyton rubrum MR850]EZF44197.1 hypothetical protein H102_02505 [Trichophyton rubrum CBS 100081]EZF54849.1 hypothetical protein H103_02518 [Trichophyton rubrum CBS 288.86]EZF65458.1 hypothetical protein H104_02496 [Trichophyton rubrum CBS 289.86]EZF76086.1 hypothetical protein H105_02523 [Tricho